MLHDCVCEASTRILLHLFITADATSPYIVIAFVVQGVLNQIENLAPYRQPLLFI